jgi:hypothetical protein
LLKIITLLIASSVGAVITGYNFYFINYVKVTDTGYVVGLGTGLALHYAAFGVAHFFLAVKYKSMAVNVPLLLEGKDQIIPSPCDVAVYWTLVALNVIAPIAYGVLGSTFRYIVLTLHGSPPQWMALSFNIVLDVVAVL